MFNKLTNVISGVKDAAKNLFVGNNTESDDHEIDQNTNENNWINYKNQKFKADSIIQRHPKIGGIRKNNISSVEAHSAAQQIIGKIIVIRKDNGDIYFIATDAALSSEKPSSLADAKYVNIRNALEKAHGETHKASQYENLAKTILANCTDKSGNFTQSSSHVLVDDANLIIISGEAEIDGVMYPLITHFNSRFPEKAIVTIAKDTKNLSSIVGQHEIASSSITDYCGDTWSDMMQQRFATQQKEHEPKSPTSPSYNYPSSSSSSSSSPSSPSSSSSSSPIVNDFSTDSVFVKLATEKAQKVLAKVIFSNAPTAGTLPEIWPANGALDFGKTGGSFKDNNMQPHVSLLGMAADDSARTFIRTTSDGKHISIALGNTLVEFHHNGDEILSRVTWKNPNYEGQVSSATIPIQGLTDSKGNTLLLSSSSSSSSSSPSSPFRQPQCQYGNADIPQVPYVNAASKFGNLYGGINAMGNAVSPSPNFPHFRNAQMGGYANAARPRLFNAGVTPNPYANTVGSMIPNANINQYFARLRTCGAVQTNGYMKSWAPASANCMKYQNLLLSISPGINGGPSPSVQKFFNDCCNDGSFAKHTNGWHASHPNNGSSVSFLPDYTSPADSMFVCVYPSNYSGRVDANSTVDVFTVNPNNPQAGLRSAYTTSIGILENTSGKPQALLGTNDSSYDAVISAYYNDNSEEGVGFVDDVSDDENQ
jgi:hypothetical protein